MHWKIPTRRIKMLITLWVLECLTTAACARATYRRNHPDLSSDAKNQFFFKMLGFLHKSEAFLSYALQLYMHTKLWSPSLIILGFLHETEAFLGLASHCSYLHTKLWSSYSRIFGFLHETEAFLNYAPELSAHNTLITVLKNCWISP